MSVSLVTLGGADLETYFRTLPERTDEAMRIAINSVAGGKGMTAIKKRMMDEINFPSGYLNGDRLKVTQKARTGKLEAVITGRKRATSLARFVAGAAVVGSRRGAGLSVRVKKGKTTYLKSAWLVRLKSGASMSEDN